MKRLLLPVASLCVVCAAPSGAQAPNTSDCGLLPLAGEASTPPHPPSARDLIELRDLGYPAALPSTVELAISPDRQSLAFPVQRARLDSNGYCSGIIVLPLSGRREPRLIFQTPEIALQSMAIRGPMIPGASPVFVRPRWSPDGQWLAFLAARQGAVQLWRVRSDGSSAVVVPTPSGEVEDFAWSRDARAIIVSVRAGNDTSPDPGEAEQGYHYDARFVPEFEARPLPVTGATRDIQRIDLAEGTQHPATALERQALASEAQSDAVMRAPTGGASAWTAPLHAERFLSPRQVHLAGAAAPDRVCTVSECGRARQLWWAPDGRAISFLTTSGWAGSQSALYHWQVGRKRPRVIRRSDAYLAACSQAGSRLICAEESSTRPRHIVAIDTRSGKTQTLFDPNPALRTRTLGRVERLHWTNAMGSETFGDLVYPIGYRTGQTYPLIVTTYQSRGFLRGATGDEYPIQLFAAHGFVVLSVERPRDVGIDSPGIIDAETLNAYGMRDWLDRRSVQSSIASGVQLLVARGIVDPRRIGITGLSDGGTTVQFGLLNSTLFAAASLSSCCTEPIIFQTLLGPASAGPFRRAGYPMIGTDPLFWKPMSLIENAPRMTTPLLMQLSDSEYLGGVASWQALHDHGAPADLFVFADESHVKLQPRHRLAVYDRNLAWFDFWLRDTVDPDLAKPQDFERWKAWKAARAASSDSGGLAPATP